MSNHKTSTDMPDALMQLWQDQMTRMMQDPETLAAWSRASQGWWQNIASMMAQTGAGAPAGNTMNSGTSPFNGPFQSMMQACQERSTSHAAAPFTATSDTAKTGTTPTDSASVVSGTVIQQLATRLDQLEQRLRNMEQAMAQQQSRRSAKNSSRAAAAKTK